MLEDLKWGSLEQRRENSRLKLLGKIVVGRVAISIEDYLSKSDTRTRTAHSNKFRVYRCNTQVFKNSFFPRTVVSWNRTSQQELDSLLEAADPIELD